MSASATDPSANDSASLSPSEVETAGIATRSAPLTPSLWRRRIGRALVMTDAVTIALCSLAAYLLRDLLGMTETLPPFSNEIPVALAVLPLWLIVFYSFGCYRPHFLNTGGEAFRRFAAASIGGLFILGFASFALNLQLSRFYVFSLFISVFFIGGLSRFALRRYLTSQRDAGNLIQSVLIAGADDEAVEVAHAFARARFAGYRVIGFLDDGQLTGTEVDGGLKILGPLAEATEIARENGAGLVLVSPTAVPAGTLGDLIVSLEGSPVDVAIAPSLFEVVTRRVIVENVDNVPVLHVGRIRIAGPRAVLKRGFDVVGSISLLALFWPLMFLATIAIRREDGRPALFRQTRVGRDGQNFTVLKFRTMAHDAEEKLSELTALNEAGEHLFKVRDDPRITRTGRVLRRWSIDEMPQLWNVLRGEMSLIGPRPALPDEVADYDEWQSRRLRARPGISGYWQVSGRSDVSFDEAVRLDLFYIANWSLGFDLYLTLRTVRAVLSRAGAY